MTVMHHLFREKEYLFRICFIVLFRSVCLFCVRLAMLQMHCMFYIHVMYRFYVRLSSFVRVG